MTEDIVSSPSTASNHGRSGERGDTPKSLQPLVVDVHSMLKRRRFALSEAVDIKHRNQVVQLIVTGKVQRLPHGPLGTLSVTEQTVDAIPGKTKRQLNNKDNLREERQT